MVKHWLSRRALSCAIAALALGGQVVLAEDRPEKAAEETGKARALFFEKHEAAEHDAEAADRLLEKSLQSKYWIGVGCEPVSAALQAQLDLAQGLVVQQLMPGSPAEKAGIQVHDVLLRFGKTKLTSVEQLIDVVDEQGDEEVEVLLVRGGREKTVTLSPAERPEEMARDVEVRQRELQEQIEKMQAQHKAMTMTFIRPGVALPPGQRPRTIPDDVSITVHKQGGKPARIEVQRGKESWTATDDALDKLPAEVRQWVQQVRGETIDLHLPALAGDAAARRMIRILPAPPAKDGFQGARMIVKPLAEGSLAELDKKLDQVLESVQRPSDVEKLHDEVKRLREDVDQLRQQLDERERDR